MYRGKSAMSGVTRAQVVKKWPIVKDRIDASVLDTSAFEEVHCSYSVKCSISIWA